MHTRTFALSLVASLLLIASALYAAPTGVTSAAPGLPTPGPVCIPVHSVALSGPAVGDVGIYLAYHVAASAMGFAPTLPITVEWTVTDLDPVVQELEGGPEGSYEFRWELGGVKTIHVTAANACTTTPAEATLEVTINPLPVDEVPVETVTLTGPTTGVTDTYVGYQVAVSAVESPPTLPVTIDWAVTDLTPVRQEIESGSATSYEFRWDRGGVKTIHVTATNAHTTTPAEATLEVVIYPLPVDDAPADIYRRAARFLEEQRVSGQAPEWEDAVLASGAFRGSVMPMYRPDIAEAAYYEFTVFRPDGDLYQPAGFLILSAGEHDYPVTNWSVGGTPPSERLRQQASDAEEQATRFLKLDALSYVAENSLGERIATHGDLPPRIILPDGWAETPPPITSVSWVPTTITDVDAAYGMPAATPAPIISGTLETPIAGTWGSWEEFKTSYASEYAPFLTRLAERAAVEWTAERWAQEYGYTLFEGDSVSVPLFEGHTGITYEGPGLDLISTEVLTPAGAGAVLRVTAIDSVPHVSSPVTSTVTYAGGIETIRFMVVGTLDHVVHVPVLQKGVPPEEGVAMGMLANLTPEDATLGADAGAWTATGASAAAEPQATAPGTLATDGYTYWYVGGTKAKADALQAWYDQFDASTLPYPYTGGCMSGCGPTAWAMLIAWGDRQAASGANSAWAGRWGLYREDGGYGADRMAPRWWDDVNEGEGVRHMIGEIRDAVDTFCPWGDSGATWPTDMWRVIDYLNGRSGMQVRTWSLPAGIGLTGYEEDDLESKARNVIRNEGDWARPTVIGTGFLSHYPLAYGYRQKQDQMCFFQTCTWEGCTPYCQPVLRKGFYVNQGWGETTGEWVNSNLFFTGRLTPHQSYIDDVGLYRRATSWWLYDYGHDGHQDVMRGDYGSPGWPSTLRPTMADLDSDGVIDDLAAYVFEYWDASIRYDWRVDLDTDGTADGTLEKFSSHANGWPFALDWDRDGYVDDLAVFMPLWDASPPVRHQLAVRVNGNPVQTFFQDVVGFDDARIPVGGDFDRDGYHDDIAYFAPSTATWHYDLDHDYTFDGTSGPFGAAETLPISGDFDHDGYADDIGVYQPSTGEWLYDYDHNASGRYDAKRGPWGAPGDLPFAGNLDTR